MKFYNMGNKPLVHDVYCKSKIVIPAGTTNVKIAFRQSHLKRFDDAKKQWIPMNVYLYKGNCYHM